MSDEDRAQELELREWENNNKSKGAPAKFAQDDPRYGSPECVECDAPMPLVRREYGFHLCVDCKTLQELQA